MLETEKRVKANENNCLEMEDLVQDDELEDQMANAVIKFISSPANRNP